MIPRDHHSLGHQKVLLQLERLSHIWGAPGNFPFTSIPGLSQKQVEGLLQVPFFMTLYVNICEQRTTPLITPSNFLLSQRFAGWKVSEMWQKTSMLYRGSHMRNKIHVQVLLLFKGQIILTWKGFSCVWICFFFLLNLPLSKVPWLILRNHDF